MRVDLHGRRVRGWVVAEGPGASRAVDLKPIAKVSPGFVAPDLVALSAWAAWRWAGTRRRFLATATEVSRHPDPMIRPRNGAVTGSRWRERTVVRLAPAIDPWETVVGVAALGPTLLLVPSLARVQRWQRRLHEAGMDSVVVGARAGAWAPCPGLAAVVVLDAHDEAYTEERAPTWNAWVVAAERAKRAAVPCVLVTPVPTQEIFAWGDLVETDRAAERRGWARLEVVDRRGDDPRTGLWSSRAVDVVRGGGRVLCVLNRTGRAKLLRCGACGTVATCERCASAVHEDADARLRCARCDAVRPPVCRDCGAGRFKALRIGTARAAEQLAALAGEPVGEVTSSSTDLAETRVLIGTEAVLHRVGRADAVVFVDLDAELSAPHFRANEATLALLARAARVVRGRIEDGRVVVQTRQPNHPVLAAVAAGDFGTLAAAERDLRASLGLPPFAAMAQLSGDAAAAAAEALRGRMGVEVIGPGNDGSYLVRAGDHQTLCDALVDARAARIAVDPVRT